jgi:hypothetical protein
MSAEGEEISVDYLSHEIGIPKRLASRGWPIQPRFSSAATGRAGASRSAIRLRQSVSRRSERKGT